MRRSGLAVPVAVAAFVALGLPDGMLGVAWPSMRSAYGQPLAALGLVLVGGTCGYLAGSAASGFLADRWGTAALLAAGAGVTAVALLDLAVAPAWPLFLGGSAVLGLGSGTLDAGVNAYVAVNHGPRSMNLLHAGYGVGASAGSALLTGLTAAGPGWRPAYGGLVAVNLCFAATYLATAGAWRGGQAQRQGPAGSLRGAPAVVLAAGLALFAMYAAVEVGAGRWSYTYLTAARGDAPAVAGLSVSAYWASLTLGRLAAAAGVASVTPVRLLHAGVALILASVALLWWGPGPGAALAALVGIGLGAAPIFPALVALTPGRVGAAAATRAVGLQLAASGTGGSLGPAAMGLAMQQGGVGLLAPCLAAAAVAVAALHLALVARTGGR